MRFLSHSQRSVLVIALAILLGGTLLYHSRMLFDGVMGAVILFTIFLPLHTYLTEQRKWNSGVSAFTVLLASFLAFILPFVSLIWMVYDKIDYYRTHINDVKQLKEKFSPLLTEITTRIDFDKLVDDSREKLIALFSETVNSLSGMILQVTVMYLLLYFMFKEHKKLKTVLLKYLPFNQQTQSKFTAELRNMTYSSLLGQGLISMVQALFIMLGFWIFGLKDPVFWGSLSFFLSFVPFVGSALVYVPAGLLQLYVGNTFAGAGILIWGVVLVGASDNIIRFYLAKKLGNIHPLITILGVIIGVPAFGLLGIMYGPLLISYFLLLMRILEEQSPKKRRRYRMRNN